jgi:hypothetical protein
MTTALDFIAGLTASVAVIAATIALAVLVRRERSKRRDLRILRMVEEGRTIEELDLQYGRVNLATLRDQVALDSLLRVMKRTPEDSDNRIDAGGGDPSTKGESGGRAQAHNTYYLNLRDDDITSEAATSQGPAPGVRDFLIHGKEPSTADIADALEFLRLRREERPAAEPQQRSAGDESTGATD